MPDYDHLSFNDNGQTWMVYGSPEGVYGYHGDVNPPIPYKGKIFMHRSNAILAFGETSSPPVELPMAEAVEVQNANLSTPTDKELEDQLAEHVQKIIDTGHLQPGYNTQGLIDIKARDCADRWSDYFHYPGDTLIALIRALPYLPASLQTSTRAYLQAEFAAYPPYQYNHIGWRDGASREIFDRPPEFEADRVNFPPQTAVNNFDGWTFAPHSFYALWKYADEFGNAQAIYEASHKKLPSPPSDEVLISMPHVQNAFIAGYIGYLELEELAGQPETPGVRSELERLMALRISSFSTTTSYDTRNYCRTLTASQNFMYLVPELAKHLRANLEPQVQMALNEYEKIIPYWFVSRSTVTYGESVIHPLYDSFTMFQAKAMILEESRGELAKYLDVPGFYVGDLFYIQKLIYLLEADT